MKPKKSKLRYLLDSITMQSILSDLSHAVSLERFGPRLSDRVLWHGMTDEPKIALTFDDGPHITSTPRILDTLYKFEIPATFFLVGKHVESHFELAQDVVRSGHEIGNHTFNHSPLFLLTNSQIKDEIIRTDELLRKIDGTDPQFLRPPLGLFTRRVLDIVEQSGYKTVIGDVYPRDPHLPGKEKIVHRVLRRTVAGSIIILHDGGNTKYLDRSQTEEALLEIIPRLKNQGFEFVNISDLYKEN